MTTLLQAIARQEGFYNTTTLAARNHNPGNIIYGDFARNHGAIGGNAGYAVFPDDKTGWSALYALLSGPAYKGLTVQAAIDRFCPPSNGTVLTQGNQPDAYVRDVCDWCECSPSTIIDGLLGTGL
jgi:hypothetical protein